MLLVTFLVDGRKTHATPLPESPETLRSTQIDVDSSSAQCEPDKHRRKGLFQILPGQTVQRTTSEGRSLFVPCDCLSPEDQKQR